MTEAGVELFDMQAAQEIAILFRPTGNPVCLLSRRLAEARVGVDDQQRAGIGSNHDDKIGIDVLEKSQKLVHFHW